MTSLASIFADPHIDDLVSEAVGSAVTNGILAWLAEVDPAGDPGSHARVLSAVADAAIRYERLGLIPAQDGAQAALAWLAEQRTGSATGPARTS